MVVEDHGGGGGGGGGGVVVVDASWLGSSWTHANWGCGGCGGCGHCGCGGLCPCPCPLLLLVDYGSGHCQPCDGRRQTELTYAACIITI